jgi:hypothetical protein
MTTFFSYRSAALFVAISAILHLISPVFAGLAEDVMLLLPTGVLYLFFAWGLSKGWRWLAYIAFIVLLIGGLFAFAFSFGGSMVPGWLYAGIAIADLLAVLALFGALWRSKPAIA